MITGYDAHGNFLPPQQLIDEIERLRTDRNAVIEECARAAESYAPKFGPVTDRDRIVAAVRALKDQR